jgi:hypothetical protein
MSSEESTKEEEIEKTQLKVYTIIAYQLMFGFLSFNIGCC